jgi:DNA topoisomerase I
MNLVRAQEARRGLDRVVGYVVSPLLTKAVNDGSAFSAGRVQSPAVRLVVEREERIRAFSKVHHFGVRLHFDDKKWSATWDTKGHVIEDQPYVLDRDIGQRAADLRQLTVTASQQKPSRRSPPPPFSTSLLLQAASVKLGFKPELTARLAQRLFEQGAVTYIRTDSTNLSAEAVAAIRAYANANDLSIPDQPRTFASKQNAQEAHEAIRPTHIDALECGENDDEKALYRLIWRRAVASQLADAEYMVTSLVLASDGFRYVASSRRLQRPGWLALTAEDDTTEKQDEEEPDNGDVPLLPQGSNVTPCAGEIVAKATKPPPRFTHASLIAKLEAEGIGRPSTYPEIMRTIMARQYLAEDGRFLAPTKRAFEIAANLKKGNFSFFNLSYTRELETHLDEIAEGKRSYRDTMQSVASAVMTEAKGFERTLVAAGIAFTCPNCGSALRRFARKHKSNGKPTGEYAWACSAESCTTFLDDENGKPVERRSYPCPNCGSPLRRFARKHRTTGNPTGEHAWACSSTTCTTFLDDQKGKPQGKTK